MSAPVRAPECKRFLTPNADPRRRRAVVAAGAAALCVLLPLSAQAHARQAVSAKSAAAARAAALPDHLAVGLAAAPGDVAAGGWLPRSGVRWDASYQYLAGGVNTGRGWSTWNEKAQFALWYAQSAAARHYLPVFPYYQIRQSHGPCDKCAENQVDLANLNAPATMKAYYNDFRLLMQRLGPGTSGGVTGFGKPAVVLIEPDLSGYANQAVLDRSKCFGFCTKQGNDPSYLKASVASSGALGTAGLPNTYVGFNRALLGLRDRYAPNVLLAFHVSTWAPLHDIGSETDTSLYAPDFGEIAARFANKAGVAPITGSASTYDLVTNDVADRDAGFYQHVYGANRWWDARNEKAPNFHRWEGFVKAIATTTGKPVMVWQIPLGNQYYRTMNNTWGHYQDNRIEYFFGHLTELRSAGITGLLFGAGNDGSTTYTDARGDGITNPSTICVKDGLSSGTVCNSHRSTKSDDDGGFLRAKAGAYLTKPLPLTR